MTPRYIICYTWAYQIDYEVSGYLRVSYPGIISAKHGYTQLDHKVGKVAYLDIPGIRYKKDIPGVRYKKVHSPVSAPGTNGSHT